MINKEAVSQYLDLIFSFAEEGFVALRGLGEKGTDKEGVFRETIWLPANHPDLLNMVMQHVERWGQHNVASFLIPGVTQDQGGHSKDVLGFTNILVDIDSGDASEKLEEAERLIGKASLVVQSSPGKLHAYWMLSEFDDDVERVCKIRHRIAVLIGADESFGVGRAHQPVRIPGSIHAKNSKRQPVEIIRIDNGLEYHLDDIEDALPPEKKPEPLDFSDAPLHGGSASVSDTMTQTVQEGAEGEITRFAAFSKVAGYWIRWAAEGKGTLEEAYDSTVGWMLSNMEPPWPDDRARREFNALAAKHQITQTKAQEIPGVTDRPGGLAGWAVTHWTRGEPPARRFLVKGLVQASVPQVLVAEGGAGKTFLTLELGLKLATYQPGDQSFWMGEPLTDECEGKRVVIITAEDDQDELNIRIQDMDPDGKRHDAGDRLIVLPLVNCGGVFNVVIDLHGQPHASPKFKQLVDEIREIGDVALVVIDTFSSMLHGEENNSTTVKDWFAIAAGTLCGELGAALMVTHHIRKGDPITSTDDMKAAVRGSGAIINGVRAGIGVWHDHEWSRRLKAMKIEPQPNICYRSAIIKANNPEMFKGVKTLLRNKTGLLEDATSRDKIESKRSGSKEQMAWLAFAIQRAAEAGHPYTKTGANGFHERADTRPPVIAEIGKHKVSTMIEDLMKDGRLVSASGLGSSGKKWLDVPDGPIATDTGMGLAPGRYTPPAWDEYYYDSDINQIFRKVLQ